MAKVKSKKKEQGSVSYGGGSSKRALVLRVISAVFVVLSLWVHQSEAARVRVRSFTTTLLDMPSVSDFAVSTAAVTSAYMFTYFMASSILEYTNPTPKDEKRLSSIRKEVKLGVVALIADTSYATLWLWLVDEHTPFFGWYETHEFGWRQLLLNVVVYLFWMDTWFWWSHRLLHTPWWWKHVHHVHHQFLHPSAFSQDAVHPLEAVVQGPMGHHALTLVYPMHPVVMAVMGFFTAVYATCAHDGRSLDLNDHCKHHTHKHVNFGLYWGFWDYIMGTRYNPNKTPRWKSAVLELKPEDRMQ